MLDIDHGFVSLRANSSRQPLSMMISSGLDLSDLVSESRSTREQGRVVRVKHARVFPVACIRREIACLRLRPMY